MPRPPDEGHPFDSSDDDERVGEAIETYLALAEQGQPPAIEEFAARYPDLKDDVHAALEGLELVHGLLGLGSAAGSGSGHGSAADRRIESGQRIAGYRVVRRAGSRRDGYGLRSGAHGAGPAGRAQGAGRPRRARFLGAAAVPQRGPHGRRAASHPHRAGFRRRPGRRPVLLRHAADRGERSGPRGAPSPPHPAARLRRRRQRSGTNSGRWGIPASRQPFRLGHDRRSTRDSAGFGSESPRDGPGDSPVRNRLKSWRRSDAEPLARPSSAPHDDGQSAPLVHGARRFHGLVGHQRPASRRSRSARLRRVERESFRPRWRLWPGAIGLRDDATTSSRRRSIHRGGPLIFDGWPRSAFRRPMPWRTPITKG